MNEFYEISINHEMKLCMFVFQKTFSLFQKRFYTLAFFAATSQHPSLYNMTTLHLMLCI